MGIFSIFRFEIIATIQVFRRLQRRKMIRQQTIAKNCLSKDEEDFRQFESKIDEVSYLLKGMNSCDRKYQSPAKDFTKE